MTAAVSFWNRYQIFPVHLPSSEVLSRSIEPDFYSGIKLLNGLMESFAQSTPALAIKATPPVADVEGRFLRYSSEGFIKSSELLAAVQNGDVLQVLGACGLKNLLQHFSEIINSRLNEKFEARKEFEENEANNKMRKRGRKSSSRGNTSPRTRGIFALVQGQMGC